jgi:hypothetical protein
MKSLLMASGAIFCALSFAACMADTSPPSTDDQSDNLAAADKTSTPEVVSVPDELSFANLPGAIDNGTVTTDACSVTLVYCKDPRWSPHYPSYCYTGSSCGNAVNIAASICRSTCGSGASCSTFYDLGKC